MLDLVWSVSRLGSSRQIVRAPKRPMVRALQEAIVWAPLKSTGLMVGPFAGCHVVVTVRCCLQVTGDITYNGHTFSEFNVTRTARYVDQRDLHNPQLTVRETLTFSAMCQGPGYQRSVFCANSGNVACFLLGIWAQHVLYMVESIAHVHGFRASSQV
jgi:hypothetical protein